MHTLHYVLSGYCTFLGGPVSCLAALCVLLFVVRKPPDYSNDQDRATSIALFVILVLMNAGLVVVKFHATYGSRNLWDKMSIFICIKVAIIAWAYNYLEAGIMDQAGIFSDKSDDIRSAKKNDEYWLSWLVFELIIGATYLAGSAFYLAIVHSISKPRM